MRIRLLTSIAGTNGSFAPGEETDSFNDADAERLVAAGYAEKVSSNRKAKVEKATAKAAVETAATS